MTGSEPHVLDLVGPPPHRILRYDDVPTGIVDVTEPDGAARGLVVLVHGGFWRAAYDRTHLRPLAAALAADGWLVALPEYRRIGDPGGGWPGALDDVVAVLDAVPAALGADPAAAAVVGHSAGGHLAVLAAGRVAVPPRVVVSLAGVLDLASAHRDRLSGGVVAELLADADPSEAAIAAADPMRAPVPAGAVRLLHGLDDAEVPPAYSRDYAARDPRIRLELLSGVDHYDVIDPRAAAFAALRAALS